MITDKPILTNKEVYPTDEVLKGTLGDSFETFTELRTILNTEYGLELQWIWYIDGGWLCKVLKKSKNLCWLSPWDGLFRVTFFFMERHVEAFMELDIAEKLKTDFATARIVGKMLPMIIEMRDSTYLTDVERILEFKLKAK